MIYHSTRMTFKPGVPPEKQKEVVESLRNQGRMVPSVKAFIVGHDIGGEYEIAATYVIEDLDGYWEYLMHPSHHHTDMIGLPVGDKFVSYDVVDDDDPDMAAKIAALHQRRYDGDAELTKLVSDLGSYQGSAAPGAHGNH
jgi:hypothetical protein